MGAFFVYILKSSVCLVVFYLFYRLLLSKDTFHRLNRVGLLCLVLLSVAIPFCRITMPEPIVMQPAVLDLETLLLMASFVGKQSAEAVPFWILPLLWIYIGGVIFFFGQFVYSCGNTIRMIRKGTVSRLGNGIRLVITPEAVTPFSWMRYILISPKDMEESGKEILAHESAHIRRRHSVDLWISEACILFHWFNPAAWLLRQELQHIHEYEADESVLTEGVDARKYQLLLIKKAVGSQRFTSMANSLNHSSLKKRITMMLKRKSNPWARLKYLYVLPLAAMTVVSFARPEIVRELDRISSVKFREIVPVKEIPGVKNAEKPLLTADSISVTSSVTVNPSDIAGIDSVWEQSAEFHFDQPADWNFNFDQLPADWDLGQLNDLDLPDIDINLNVNLDSMATQFASLPDMLMSLQNLELDTAEVRKMTEEIRAKMKAGREEWREKQSEWEEHSREAMRRLQESIKAQKLTDEQKQAMKEKMKEAQKNVEKAIKEAQKQKTEWQKETVTRQKVAGFVPPDAYIIIDGKEATDGQMKALDPKQIESVTVLKDERAVAKYGEKAKNGVIEITTKHKIK